MRNLLPILLGLIIPALSSAADRSVQPRIAPSWNSVVSSFPPGIKPFGLNAPQIPAFVRVAERAGWQPRAGLTQEQVSRLAETYAIGLAGRVTSVSPGNSAALGAELRDFQTIAALAPKNSAAVTKALDTLAAPLRQKILDAGAAWNDKEDPSAQAVTPAAEHRSELPAEWKLAKAVPRLSKGEERALLENQLRETSLHIENLKLLRKGLVHDVNNNIMVVGGGVELLVMETGPQAPGAPLYAELKAAAKLMAQKMSAFLNRQGETKSESSPAPPGDEIGRLRNRNQEALKEVEGLILSLNDLAKDIDSLGKAMAANIKRLLSLEHNSRGPAAAAAKKDLVEILRRVNGQAQIVEDYQNLSRLEAGKLKLAAKIVDVLPPVKEILKSQRSLAERKKIEIALDFPEDAPRVKSDPAAFSTILRNLIGNAVKYTPENGRVAIGMRNNPRRPGYATIFVEDTGIGIKSEDKEKITAGFRTEEGQALAQGHGIGLELVKKMVEASGSALRIDSQPGKGSRFYFDLPLARPPPKKQSPFQSDIEAAILLRHNQEHMSKPIPGTRALRKGQVDETVGSFLINERPLVKYLKDRGHELIKLPEGGENMRYSDALVDREITEFKTFKEPRPDQPPADSDAVLNRVKESLHNGGQAPHIIMDVRLGGLSYEEAMRSFRRLHGNLNKRLAEGKGPGPLKTLRIIGLDYDVKTDLTKPYQDPSP